jgi:mRNA interferase HicA
VKRRDLIKRIREAARARGLTLELVREGSKHSVFAVGGFEFTVPRHGEINEYTAHAIMKDLADQLGEDWWRR